MANSSGTISRWARVGGWLADTLIWWPMLLLASAVWFFFGARLMGRFGPDALAPAAGVMIATAVGVTLWWWSVRDRRSEALAAGACPRCHAAIEVFEESPRPGALSDGLRAWHCPRCGLEASQPLTSVRRAS